MFYRFIHTNSSKTTILIRVMVGAVFLSEGIQKFIYPAMRGAGRFESMGFPFAQFFATFVAIFEILCGLYFISGFFTAALLWQCW